MIACWGSIRCGIFSSSQLSRFQLPRTDPKGHRGRQRSRLLLFLVWLHVGGQSCAEFSPLRNCLGFKYLRLTLKVTGEVKGQIYCFLCIIACGRSILCQFFCSSQLSRFRIPNIYPWGHGGGQRSNLLVFKYNGM